MSPSLQQTDFTSTISFLFLLYYYLLFSIGRHKDYILILGWSINVWFSYLCIKYKISNHAKYTGTEFTDTLGPYRAMLSGCPHSCNNRHNRMLSKRWDCTKKILTFDLRLRSRNHRIPHAGRMVCTRHVSLNFVQLVNSPRSTRRPTHADVSIREQNIYFCSVDTSSHFLMHL